MAKSNRSPRPLGVGEITRIDTSDTYKKQDKQLLKEMPRNRFTDWLFGLIMDINHEERKK